MVARVCARSFYSAADLSSARCRIIIQLIKFHAFNMSFVVITMSISRGVTQTREVPPQQTINGLISHGRRFGLKSAA